MGTRLLLLVLLAAAAAAPLRGAPPDTTAAGVTISVIPRIDAMYSPSRGFGPVLDITVQHLGWQGSRLEARSATMTRHGEYSTFLFTGDPLSERLYGGLGARFVGTRAYRFYGLGPLSDRDDALGFGARRIEAEGRLGWHPLGPRTLALQPAVLLRHDHMRRVEEVQEGAFERLDAASVASVERAIGNPSTGLVLSLAAILDRLDEPRHPRSGVLLQAAASRYFGLGGDPFGYWRASVLAHGAAPLAGRTVVTARAIVVVTREVASERPVPFFALPAIGSDLVGAYPQYRLVGRDLLVLSAGLRFPLFEVMPCFGTEVFIAAHALNAYDDLSRQFEPRLSFARRPAAGRRDGSAPLRPALSVGGHLIALRHGRPVVSGQIGFSPEGLQLAGLDFIVDLRRGRPPVR